MKVLVVVPRKHANFNSIDRILDGTASCSETNGAIIRMTGMLVNAGNICDTQLCFLICKYSQK